MEENIGIHMDAIEKGEMPHGTGAGVCVLPIR